MRGNVHHREREYGFGSSSSRTSRREEKRYPDYQQDRYGAGPSSASNDGYGPRGQGGGHFYPEGGWGWIVCACAFLAHVTTNGAQLSAGALHIVLANKFTESSSNVLTTSSNSDHGNSSINSHQSSSSSSGTISSIYSSNNKHLPGGPEQWLGPFTWSISCLFSPLVVNLCRWKNVRVVALVGGLLFPLSIIFTSFATELHQIFFTFGLLGGIGSCLVRESSNMVLGEYFRRRRYFVEQVAMAGTGVGVTLFSLLYLSLGRHVDWGTGFRIGAAMTTICALLPAFYRPASQPYRQTHHRTSSPYPSYHKGDQSPKGSRSYGMLIPLGGDICYSLRLFCIPSLQPLLWSAAFSAFGIYAPLFLMSDFGRREGLSGGSLLLLQTHIGLGLSLGVILGAILTIKKCQICTISPRLLCCSSSFLTGLSMIAISSVKGYYGYSMSAWAYGIALGSHLYTFKILTMELTRTRHWERIWSLIQSLMSPGILLGTWATAYFGKPGFYLCSTFMLIGAGLIGFQLVDLSRCGSPHVSTSDGESPIPPAPPPISPRKYPHHSVVHPTSVETANFPLRKSISMTMHNQPGHGSESEYDDSRQLMTSSRHSPYINSYCPECDFPPSSVQQAQYPGYGTSWEPNLIMRSVSLPQESTKIQDFTSLRTTRAKSSSRPILKTIGTQTAPSSPHGGQHHTINKGEYGSLERGRSLKKSRNGRSSRRQSPGTQGPGGSGSRTVMFDLNSPYIIRPRSTPISQNPFDIFDSPDGGDGGRPEVFPTMEPKPDLKPAFTRHHFDSSQIRQVSRPPPPDTAPPPIPTRQQQSSQQQQQQQQQQLNHQRELNIQINAGKREEPRLVTHHVMTPSHQPPVIRHGSRSAPQGSLPGQAISSTFPPPIQYLRAATPINLEKPEKISSSEFRDIEEPKFNSLRRPAGAGPSSSVGSSIISNYGIPPPISVTSEGGNVDCEYCPHCEAYNNAMRFKIQHQQQQQLGEQHPYLQQPNYSQQQQQQQHLQPPQLPERQILPLPLPLPPPPNFNNLQQNYQQQLLNASHLQMIQQQQQQQHQQQQQQFNLNVNNSPHNLCPYSGFKRRNSWRK